MLASSIRTLFISKKALLPSHFPAFLPPTAGNGRSREVGGSGRRGRGGSCRSASVDGLPPLSVAPCVFHAIPERRVSSDPLRGSHGGWCTHERGRGAVWVASLGAEAGDQQVAAYCGVLDKCARCFARGWAGCRGWCGACGACGVVGSTPQARLLKLAAAGCGVHAVHRARTTQFQ